MFPGIHVNRIGEWTGKPLHHRSIKTSMFTPEQNTHFITHTLLLLLTSYIYIKSISARKQQVLVEAGGDNRYSSQ